MPFFLRLVVGGTIAAMALIALSKPKAQQP
jgi:hypothetical protein